ncbi:glutamine synthetase [Zobellella endophytica]|uniref:Glutamine synthetase n=1 Tax=Zobellella endophytica TaxID=2116700 RepID=A0A2P7RBG5_9GAMM|nr:glutamine synthetase family protein [Zobellella endophytica]PSJ47555.1 glutamine synthetase [Zobellella endophytica]
MNKAHSAKHGHSARHPWSDYQSVDLMLCDINGVLRGKRIQTSALENALRDGISLPASVFALDITGQTVEETGLGFAQGDSDRVCRLLPHTLAPVPWHRTPSGQILMTMEESDGSPFFADPRHVLQKVVQRLLDKGLRPCVAVELEFYLVDQKVGPDGLPQPPILPGTDERMHDTQVYSLDDLDSWEDFLVRVAEVCEMQHIPADNAVAEYAPGQFEINLTHQNDAVAACDQAILLKRAIKAIAIKEGMYATFMAKPYNGQAGSGMHIHVSLLDEAGNNLFSDNHELLRQAIAGNCSMLPECMALFAPNANSYRRLQPQMFVPLHASWGFDNRTVALRIPSGDKSNTRLEHRVAGADANPYLVVAAILAAVDHGISEQLRPPAPIQGDANKLDLQLLPYRWQDALDRFAQSHRLSQYLGKDFHRAYLINKRHELAEFDQHVTPLEYQWYQHLV